MRYRRVIDGVGPRKEQVIGFLLNGTKNPDFPGTLGRSNAVNRGSERPRLVRDWVPVGFRPAVWRDKTLGHVMSTDEEGVHSWNIRPWSYFVPTLLLLVAAP